MASVTAIMSSIVTVIVLVVWYRRKTRKFHIKQKSQTAELEVDNDLYGFHKPRDVDVDSDSKQPLNQRDENSPSVQQDPVQADNPLYDSQPVHQEVHADNPMYGVFNAQAGTQETDAAYSDVNFDTRKAQIDTADQSLEYAYSKI